MAYVVLKDRGVYSFLLIVISSIRFYIGMHIHSTLCQPIVWVSHVLLDTSYLVIHGAAIRVFTTLHQWCIRGSKFEEISNITRVIHLLEQKETSKNGKVLDAEEEKEIQTILSQLSKGHLFNTPPKRKFLLEALKSHRYSLTALWNGVERNEELLHQIVNYLTSNNNHLPSDSPYKQQDDGTAPTRSRTSSFQPRQLFNE